MFILKGLKYLLQRFEAIYLKNLNNSKDFGGELMDIDLSNNHLTESSLKYLADIIRKFHGFRSINLSNLVKMKDTGFQELAKSVRESHSLEKLNLSKNSLSQQILSELFQSLTDNFVISEIIVDMKGKSIPFGFSHYTLMSMYEAYISKENINL